MPWIITLCQISSFLRPVAAGMVALMASSMVGRWDLRTEVAGVLFLVMRRMLWFVVNSMVAIRGFLMAELMASRIVRLLVLSGRAVPSLSMTMVRSRFVKTRGKVFLLAEGVEVVAEAALAAFCAQVVVGSGAIGLCGGAGVVVLVVAGFSSSLSMWVVRVAIWSFRSEVSLMCLSWTTLRCC